MNIDFSKSPDGLIPAVIQDSSTHRVLMVGFMNRHALEITQETGRVTFFSRSRQKIWTKGETSGNFLQVVKITADCDADTLLIEAEPLGAVCHTGAETCFNEENTETDFLRELEKIIAERRLNPLDNSYTSKLFAKGINKIAQKVGEEAVELIIEAKDDNIELFKNEAADLLYHLLVLFQEKYVSFDDIVKVLRQRKKI